MVKLIRKNIFKSLVIWALLISIIELVLLLFSVTHTYLIPILLGILILGLGFIFLIDSK